MSEPKLVKTIELASDPSKRLTRRAFRLEVTEGQDRGRVLESAEASVTIGCGERNELELTDRSVSRHHLRVEALGETFLLTDLGSRNGTFIDRIRIKQVMIETRTVLRLGTTVLEFVPLDQRIEVPLAAHATFGELHGNSALMRELFAKLEVVSPQDVTVLVSGETGTGKELIARSIHQRSARAGRPFIVVDCGAIPAALIESELFGSVRGAFTSSTEDRPGAFEEADGGTIFLDEIGELEPHLQPRLLRVLETGEVKRIGEARHRSVDVRVLAATNRDLAVAVNQGAFRPDLFYRLAVFQLRAPPLRDRIGDLPVLCEVLLREVAARYQVDAVPLDDTTLEQLEHYPWPGNIRELRNVLTRYTLLRRSGGSAAEILPEIAPAASPSPQPSASSLEGDPIRRPLREAKAELMENFEREYLKRLIEQSGRNVAEAARLSGVDRVHLYRLFKKYGLSVGERQ